MGPTIETIDLIPTSIIYSPFIWVVYFRCSGAFAPQPYVCALGRNVLGSSTFLTLDDSASMLDLGFSKDDSNSSNFDHDTSLWMHPFFCTASPPNTKAEPKSLHCTNCLNIGYQMEPFLLLVLLLMQAGTSCYAWNNHLCTFSVCDEIRNLSYLFRLKDEPKDCRDSRFELTCEDNHTILSLYAGHIMWKG